MDRNSQQPHPTLTRMSALYQYHNAPEVAPAHGLEYDDTPYPHSDKYPVIRDNVSTLGGTSYAGTGNYGYGKDSKYAHFENDNRPPRIIFGMKIRTFLMVAAIMLCVIVGAAVGGGVGGQQLRDSATAAQQSGSALSPTTTSSQPTASNSATTALPTATYAAPIPTYTPLSDCPASNATRYTSDFASQRSGPVAPGTGLTFTRYCDKANPFSLAGAAITAEAFVYSFADCIEVCAGANFWAPAGSQANCTAAVYQPGGGRPGNCWVGSVPDNLLATASGAGEADGNEVAILVLPVTGASSSSSS